MVLAISASIVLLTCSLDSPPVSTIAALARITNTVAHNDISIVRHKRVNDFQESFASKRRRLQYKHVHSSSINNRVNYASSSDFGPGPLSISTPSSFNFVPVQACVIGMVGHLGPPRGLAIGGYDGAVAGVPRWLTRLFHPPERYCLSLRHAVVVAYVI